MVREFLAVVVRAALQWALSSLLLANGAAFCLIAAAASSFRLGPPCLLCARVHRLLCSSHSAAGSDQEHDALRRLLCDAHVAAIAASTHSGPAQGLHSTVSASDHVDTGREDDAEKPAGPEVHRTVSIGSEICEQDQGDAGEQPRAMDRTNVQRTSSINKDDDPYVSLFELAPILALPDPQDNPDHVQELDDDMPELQCESMAGGERPTTDGLIAALRAQRSELEALRAELESERRAKAEAAENQRQLEEQSEFDREAVRLAMKLVHEMETEKHELQRQLDACRVTAQLCEAAMDTAPPPVNRLGGQQRRGLGDADEMEQEDGGAGSGDANWNDNNYQSLMDFLPGSVYSSSPDLANLLKLYSERNGGRRPTDRLTDADASTVTVVAEEEEEVVAVTATAVSDSNGASGDIASTVGASSLPESGSTHVAAAITS